MSSTNSCATNQKTPEQTIIYLSADDSLLCKGGCYEIRHTDYNSKLRGQRWVYDADHKLLRVGFEEGHANHGEIRFLGESPIRRTYTTFEEFHTRFGEIECKGPDSTKYIEYPSSSPNANEVWFFKNDELQSVDMPTGETKHFESGLWTKSTFCRNHDCFNQVHYISNGKIIRMEFAHGHPLHGATLGVPPGLMSGEALLLADNEAPELKSSSAVPLAEQKQPQRVEPKKRKKKKPRSRAASDQERRQLCENLVKRALSDVLAQAMHDVHDQRVAADSAAALAKERERRNKIVRERAAKKLLAQQQAQIATRRPAQPPKSKACANFVEQPDKRHCQKIANIEQAREHADNLREQRWRRMQHEKWQQEQINTAKAIARGDD